MSDNLKTIKELADELGVSKQNVRYHMKFLPVNKVVKNDKGQIVLNAEEQNFIKDRTKAFASKNDSNGTGIKGDFTSKEKQTDVVKSIIIADEKELFYEKLLKEKDKQINDLKSSRDRQLTAKDGQIKSLVEIHKQTQNLLDQQQRLSLQDKKLLEEYKSEINDLKALNIPSQNTTEAKVYNQSQEGKNMVAESQQVAKKWYHFWK